ncbi:MAG: helicase-associated domain-containing protein [Pseudonocardiaceae bacterium]
MAAVCTRSLAEYLSELAKEPLAAVLNARPDVLVQPVPRDFSQLAQRLGGAESLGAVLRTLNRDAVIVGQAIVALGAAAAPPGLARLLGAPERVVREVVDELCRRGLAWDGGGVLRLPERLEAHWMVEIGGGRPVAKIAGSVLAENLRAALRAFGTTADGLRKPELAARLAELMADLPRLTTMIRELPEPVRNRLEQYRRGEAGYYQALDRSRPRAGHPDSTAMLIATGLLLPVNYGFELPKEVAVAAWLAIRELRLSGRPDLPPAGAEQVAVRRASEAAAQDALRGMTMLLDEARTAPIVALKKGGVGPRERARLAKQLSVLGNVLALWIDLAYAAGLLGRAGEGYAPTQSYEQWRAAEPGQRWAELVHAWFHLEHAPTSRGIDGDRELPPPLPLDSAAGLLRRALLSAAGAGVSVRATAKEIDWFCPVHGYEAAQREEKVAAAIHEAELLGVVAADVVSEPGEQLLAVTGSVPADAVGDLARRCAALLPETPCGVILQSDLTAMVSGQPTAAVARLLKDAAVAETHGAARTWRFTPASVRAALDTGWCAQDLLAELAAMANHPVPQPLDYLITDAERRHGQIRVRGLRSCILAEEALATEILHTRALNKLHLNRLAPTVLSSPCGPDEVLARLRETGLSPVAEDAHGLVIIETRHDHQAPARGQAMITKPRSTLAATELARRLLADPRGAALGDCAGPDRDVADSGTVELLAQLNPHLDDAELDLLSDAVEHHHEVLITYRDKNGSRSTRMIQPQQLYGRWLDCWCHLRNAQRDFTVANIEAVSPVC